MMKLPRLMSLVLAGAALAVSCLSVSTAAQAAAAPATAPAPAPLATSGEYRLGSGDVVRITVFQNPDMTLETRVSEAGTLSFPLLGTVRLGGLTVSQAEQVIANGLRDGNFVKSPQVTIALLAVKGNQASVLGQVNRPGRYPIDVTDMHVTDMLANAGGVAITGADTVILSGTRDGKPYRVEIDLPGIFSANGRGQDVTVLNGDVIWVDRAPMIYIYGEVQRPGPVRLERGMTLMQALASGGGLTLRGTEKGVRVSRKDAEGKVQLLQPAMDDAVKDGDVIFVRESLF
ncbi:MAG TPA: polysaccharide export protein EpsE [Burkholderiaceae bacterium]|jgi:polysaccharide export outer membrane protein